MFFTFRCYAFQQKGIREHQERKDKKRLVNSAIYIHIDIIRADPAGFSCSTLVRYNKYETGAWIIIQQGDGD